MAHTLKLPKPRKHPLLADRFLTCSCGDLHVGLRGGAGLLLTNPNGTRALLQRRFRGITHSNTWVCPGGIIEPGESAREAAFREAREEAGIPEGAVDVVGEYVDQHDDWAFTTIVGTADPRRVPARVTTWEAVDARWVPLRDVERLPLHPGFAAVWPHLRKVIKSAG